MPHLDGDEQKERDRWLQQGIQKGWIVAFCLNHESGLWAAELEDDEALEKCAIAYRLAEYSPTTLL